MNAEALLTLISNLAEQLYALQAENARLRAKLEAKEAE